MRRAFLMGVLMVALPARLVAIPAGDPWKFTGTEQKEAEKRYPDQYWYVHYPKAVTLLSDPKGNVDEAIARLRLAIVLKPDSRPDADHPITHEAIPYFPYFHLAVAFDRKGDAASAQKCLDRESAQIGKTKLASSFNALRTRVAALAGARGLSTQAEKVLKWEDGREFALSPEAVARLPRIRGLKERLDASGADAQEASQELTSELTALFRNEIRAGAALLSRLSGEPWRGAFAANPRLIDPSSCKEPPGESGVDAVKAAGTAVEQCGRAVLLATRQAGGGVCGRLAELRARAEKSAKDFRGWIELEGGAPPPPEPLGDLPQACGLKWTEMTGSKAAESFGRLDAERMKVNQTLEEKRKEIEARLAAKREQLRKKLDEVLARLPGVPGDCVQILQMGQAATKLKAFRDRLSQARVGDPGVPSREVLQADQQVQPILEDLLAHVRDGVQQLQKNRACPGVATAKLDRLPADLDSYAKSRASSELESLCALARSAATDIQDCWKRNIPFVKASVDRNITLVGAAHQATAGVGESAVPKDLASCLAGGLGALKAVQSKTPGANPAAWVEEARSSQQTAAACLEKFHEASKEEWSRIVASVRDTRETLKAVSGLLAPSASAVRGAEALAGLRKRIEEIDRRLGEVESRFAAVASLYHAEKDGKAPSSGDVQRAVEGAGLAGNVPKDLWRLLTTAPAGGEQEQEVPLVVRDAVLVPELSAAKGALEQWKPIIGKVGPFAALNGAFLAFAGGDLDGAIHSLRAAQGKGHLEERGRESALAHAALSYFLFAKSVAVSAGQGDAELMESLERDVKREACLAVRADAGFRLPADLFRNQSFKKTFLAFAQAGNC